MSLKWHSTKPFDSNSSDETELQELELGWKTISRRSTYDERSCRFCGGESKWNFSRYFLHPVSASTVFFLPLSLSRSFSSFRRRGIGASLARTRIVVAIEILFPTVNRVFPCEPHGSGRGNLIFAHVEKKKKRGHRKLKLCSPHERLMFDLRVLLKTRRRLEIDGSTRYGWDCLLDFMNSAVYRELQRIIGVYELMLD